MANSSQQSTGRSDVPPTIFVHCKQNQTAEASASLELRYFANDDDERYSIQARRWWLERYVLALEVNKDQVR